MQILKQNNSNTYLLQQRKNDKVFEIKYLLNKLNKKYLAGLDLIIPILKHLYVTLSVCLHIAVVNPRFIYSLRRK